MFLSYLIIIYYNHLILTNSCLGSRAGVIHETEEMGYTPESAIVTGNYNVKLICSPEPTNDP